MKALILSTLLPLFVGPLTRLIVDQLKKLIAKLDAAPAWAKQVVAAVVAAGLTWGGVQTGIEFCGDDACTVQNVNLEALVGWLLALILHNSKKLAVATPPVEVSAAENKA